MNEGEALGFMLANHHPAFWFLVGVTLILAAIAYPFYLLSHHLFKKNRRDGRGGAGSAVGLVPRLVVPVYPLKGTTSSHKKEVK